MWFVLLPGLPLALAADALPDSLHLDARAFRLDNGLQVVVHEDHRAPLIALDLRYAVGAAEDAIALPPGSDTGSDTGSETGSAVPGMAHLVEHLMFRGSAHAPDGAYDDLLAAAGAENNAWTNHDQTAYHLVAPRSALDLALFLESDRMGWMVEGLDVGDLDAQRAVVRREREQLGGIELPMLRDAARYGARHPYGSPVQSESEALSSLDLAAVAAWHRIWYRPASATLVVAGDIDADQVEERVRTWFSDVPGGERPVRRPVPADARASGERRLVHTEAVDGSTLVVQWPTVARGHPDEAALDMLAAVLGGDSAARLDDAFGRSGLFRRPVARGVSVWTDNRRLDGSLVVQVDAGDRPLSRALRELDRELVRLTAEPVPAAELQRQKSRWRGWYARAADRLEDRAAVLADCTVTFGTPDCLADELDRRLAVTPADLQAAARTWLAAERRVLLSVVPSGSPDRALPGSEPLFSGASDPPAAPTQPPRVEATATVDRSAPPAVDALPTPRPRRPIVSTLDDGTLVWRLEMDEGSPLVRFGLSLGAGSLESPDRVATEILAMLVGDGGGAAWRDAVADLGARSRIAVGALRLAAEIETPSGTEADAVALLAGGLEQPHLTRSAVRAARRDALAEWDAALGRPSVVHSMALALAVYGPDHPLSWQPTRRQIRRIDLRRVRRAHLELLAAGAPSVVLTGRPGPAAEDALAGLVGYPGDRHPLVLTEPAPTPRVVLVDDPFTDEALISVSLPAPAAWSDELVATEVLAGVLGGDFDSRLIADLREEKGWTYAVDASVRAWPGHGRLTISCAVEPERAGETIVAIAAQLERLVGEPPTEAEVEAARRALLLDGARTWADLGSWSRELAVAQAYGAPPGWLADRLERLAELSADDVAVAAASMVAASMVGEATGLPGAGVWVVTGNIEATEPSLAASGVAPDAIWSSAEVVPSR